MRTKHLPVGNRDLKISSLRPCISWWRLIGKISPAMLATLVLSAFAPSNAQAATSIKQNNSTALNLAGSWNTVPGAGDIAQWDSIVTTANSTLLGADLSWNGIKVVAPGGLVTLGAGNTLTLGAAGIDLSAATKDLTLNSGLTVVGKQSWKAATGLTLNIAGTFTHGGAMVDFTSFSSGATLGTLTNDASGILGPWATTGSGTTLNYVKSASGAISAFTTQTPASAANLSNVTSATTNYSYSANSTLTGNQIGHTLRYTGAAATTALGTNSLTLDGLIHAGTGTLTISGTAGNPGLMAGPSGQLVIASNTQTITLASVISGPGTLVYGGANANTQLNVNAINTYTGGTVINSGTVRLVASSGYTLGAPGYQNVTLQSGTTLSTDRGNFTGTLKMNGGKWTEGNGFGGGWTGPVILGANSTFESNYNQSITGVVSGAGGVIRTGGGKLYLNSANLYTGPTSVNAGTLVLGAGGSIANTPSVSIAAGATFDVSAKTSPYIWSSSTVLQAAGTATAAKLQGKSGGVVNLGSQAIVLTYNGLNPPLTVSQGILSLNANPFTVNAVSPLATGTYTLVTQTTGTITSTGIYPGVIGTAIGAGKIGSISVSGANVILTIGTPSLTVNAFTSPHTAGAPGNVTVTLRDGSGNLATAYTGTVQFTSTDVAAGLPSNYTFTGADAGTHTFTGVTLKTVGTHSITATDTVTGIITGTQSGITVNPAAASSLVVSGIPSPQTIGVPANVTVTTVDAYGNTATAYTGTIHFTSSEGAAVLPSNYTFTGGDNGTHTFTNGVTLNTLGGPWSVTATDSVTGSITGTQSGIIVTATTVATRFAVTGFPGSQAAGVAGSVTVTAQSSDGSTIIGYTGTVHFTSNDGAAMLPANYTFTGGDNGTHTFSNGVTLKTAGSRSITATDNVTAISGTQSGITVGPAAAATFVVTGFPSPQFVGTPGSVTVTAMDAYGNTATTYTGTVQFTSNDGAAVLPANYTFVSGDNGMHAFSNGVTFNTAGSRSLTATDSVTGSITGTQSGITINLVPSVFTWNAANTGFWNVASNWTNNAGIVAAPDNAGKADYVLNFNVAGNYTTTHNLANGFLLNQLNFGGSAVTLASLNLSLTNNAATLPQINQSTTASANVGNNIALNADTTVGVTGNGLTLNGLISGSGGLTKTGTGTLTMGNASNTYTGETVISNGTFTSVLGGRAGFGTGAITLESGAAIVFSGPGPNLTNSGTINGGSITSNNGFGASWSGSVTLNANLAAVANNTLNFGGPVGGVGGFIKTGGGQLGLSGTNTFAGAITVQAGTLNVDSLNRISGGTANSNLGAPTTEALGTLSFGNSSTAGTLNYTGPGETTDRVLKLAGTTGGATLIQSGTASGISTTRGDSGLLKFTSNISIPGTAGVDNRKTLTLTHATNGTNGTHPGFGEIGGSIGDSLLGTAGQLATSVTKAGTGTWTLSGANTYTGATKVQAGVLAFTRSDALGSGSLDVSTGAMVRLDYIGTRQISALTFNAGAAQPNGTYGSSASLATFKDDTYFTGPGMVTVGAVVSPATTLALTSGSEPSNGGVAVSFTATVAGIAPTGNVMFYDGITLIGTSALNGSSQASLSTSTLDGGVHAITALYGGDANNPFSSSAALTHTVVESRAATSTALALTSGGNPSNAGASVTFTAIVAGSAPTGSVTFFNGSSPLGTIALNGSAQAALTTSSLAAGWRAITVRYAGDANNTLSASTSALFQTVNPPAGNGKVKVFILAGQSNMVAHSWVETGRDPNNTSNTSFVGGLGSLRNMLNREPNQYGYLADPAHPTAGGNPGWLTRSDVNVAYWGESNGLNRKGILDADFGDNGGVGAIGPEYGFGLEVGSQLGDPVLLIKYAFGGKSLKVDFRPPSSGGTVGSYYTGMVARTREVLTNLATYVPGYAGQGYEISGFGWHQGWNDAGETVVAYETNLVNLIKDLRTEFEVPDMPVSIANTGMANSSCATVIQAQMNVGNPALHPEFAGTVTTVDTRPFDFGTMLSASSDATHWNHNAESYFLVGESMGKAMVAMLPAVQPTSPFDSWAADPAQGLTAGVNDGPLDDPDKDGISNLLEFVLGGAPMVSSPSSILPALTQPAGAWTFEYDRSNLSRPPGTIQEVEYGDDLIGWNSMIIPLTSASSITITPGASTDHVSVTLPAMGNQGFVRLKVSQ